MPGDIWAGMKEAKPLKYSHVFRLWLLVLALPGLCLAQASGPMPTETDKKFERLARWLKSPDESVRVDAIQELATIHDLAVVPLILQCLQDTNTAVRGAAAWSLLLYRGPEVVNALRPVLNDEDDRVR